MFVVSFVACGDKNDKKELSDSSNITGAPILTSNDQPSSNIKPPDLKASGLPVATDSFVLKSGYSITIDEIKDGEGNKSKIITFKVKDDSDNDAGIVIIPAEVSVSHEIGACEGISLSTKLVIAKDGNNVGLQFFTGKDKDPNTIILELKKDTCIKFVYDASLHDITIKVIS